MRRRRSRCPGVKGVLTGADIPDRVYGIVPKAKDEHALAKPKVRYIGDEVACVVAVDQETAEEAARLVRVEYEELPAVFDPLDAIKEGAPVIHDRHPNNISTGVHKEFGDVEAGFAASAYVFEDKFYSQAVNHAPMEPHAALAQYDALNQDFTLWTSTQIPYFLKRNLSTHPGRRRGQGAGHQAQGGRRLRPEDRHVRQGLLRGLVRALAQPARQDRLRPRRGLPDDAPAPSDVPHGQDRRQQARQDHGATRDRPRRRRRVQLDRAADDRAVVLLRAHPLQDREPDLRGLPRLHQQAGGRRHARPRRAPAPLRHRAADRPDRRAHRCRRGRDAYRERHQGERAAPGRLPHLHVRLHREPRGRAGCHRVEREARQAALRARRGPGRGGVAVGRGQHGAPDVRRGRADVRRGPRQRALGRRRHRSGRRDRHLPDGRRAPGREDGGRAHHRRRHRHLPARRRHLRLGRDRARRQRRRPGGERRARPALPLRGRHAGVRRRRTRGRPTA